MYCDFTVSSWSTEKHRRSFIPRTKLLSRYWKGLS